MKTKTRLTAAVLVLLLVLSLLPAVSAAEETYVLPVFETSDIHGYLLDSAFDSPSDYEYRLAYIADTVDDARNGSTDKTLLLDGGDIYQGNVVSNLQDGAPLSEAFYTMEYDAVALGNHEFDWGIEKTTDPDGTMPDFYRYGERIENKIPVLSSNIYYAGTNNRVDFTQDYVILEKTAVSQSGAEKAVRVAVIGYAPDYSSSIMAARINPYTVKTSLSPVESLAKELKSSGRADAVVLLAHEDGKDMAGDLSSSTAIDLVCGGHSHSGQAGRSRTVYIQAASKACGYGYAELCFSGAAVSVSGQKHSYTGDLGSRMRDTAANADFLDSAVLEISHRAVDSVQDALTSVLGYTTAAITGDSLGGSNLSSTAGNWMTDLANRATGSKVSFTNSGGIRTSLYLTNGKHYVTKGDIYTIAPFCNLLYVYDVSYSTLLDILKWAVRGSMGLRMSGIDCYYSGSTVTALVEDGVCLYKNGEWAKGAENRTIRISANEFIATASGTPFSGLPVYDCSLTDNESFIAVLEKEGRENDGFLFVDKQPHLIKGSYSGGIPAVTYTVTTDCTEGGTITPSAVVEEGSSFTVSFAADEGYETVSLTVDGANRSIPESGELTFTNISKDHTVLVSFAKLQTDPCADYTDIIREDWYHDAADYVIAAGLMGSTRTDAFTFEPGTRVSRAMVASILFRTADGEASPYAGAFSDVPEGKWYTAAVEWTAKAGLAAGKGNGCFDPDGNVTRQELASFLFRLAEHTGRRTDCAADLSGFPDADTVPGWAAPALQWAVGAGIISGRQSGGVSLLDAGGTAMRAELASMLMRFCG